MNEATTTTTRPRPPVRFVRARYDDPALPAYVTTGRYVAPAYGFEDATVATVVGIGTTYAVVATVAGAAVYIESGPIHRLCAVFVDPPGAPAGHAVADAMVWAATTAADEVRLEAGDR